ncbi:MAG: hypothetical protein CM15mP49_16150 [Actinomycetota bacterium]|nr:MAG: hypothetical protein CM15mP49_16150 [Actinomycetota bacterium]
MSGGRFLDVVERQLPIIEDYQLQPSLVTTIIGSNDLMWRRDKESILKMQSARLILYRLGVT